MDEEKCTVDELQNVITAPTGGLTMLPSTAYDEVYPNLYLGEDTIALSRVGLRNLGITYLLNVAQGNTKYHVNGNDVMYHKVNIEYLGLEATDQMNFDLSIYFEKGADFIEKGLKSGGKVMVNCKQGVSRSATLVLAYLMIKCHMTAQEAVRTVRAKREIDPNEGFLQQICDLNETLKKAEHFGIPSS
ncbi:dual specificity phosphatase 3 [Mytilus galloprovincialis]|uniref:Dual specificity protein phosphatase n=1 Tax=Mytilus galloprovincialis TaxID=29158 RepID=A0A8B6G857_MYTGA|nr:dual specificity phosphatase 3 [Mytilus galloprovincialis]